MTTTSEITEAMVDAVADRYYAEALLIGLHGGEADLEALRPILAALYALEGATLPEIIAAPSPKAAEQCYHDRGLTPPAPLCWGNQEAPWVYHYVAARELGVMYEPDDDEMLKRLAVIAKSCSWLYCDEHLIVACDRPTAVHLADRPDGTPVLHCEGAPAIEHRDGWGCWSLWDIAVPQWLAETPRDALDPARILALKSVDQRRAGIRRLGAERLLQALGARAIDVDAVTIAGHAHPYELLEVALPLGSAPQATRWLRMIYPSGPSAGQAAIECVAPFVATCREARAWRLFGSETEAAFRAQLIGWTEPEVLT